jgi:phospholipid/cholesterol/gamma-HCH transport system permease protein
MESTPFRKRLVSVFAEVGGLTNFSIRFFKEFWRPPYEIGEVLKHLRDLGVKTFPIVSVTGVIIGLVLTIQSYPYMAMFGAEAFVPYLVSISVLRELGPVLTALIFAGRVASGVGAELGSMRVTEQIDAMETMAIDPFHFLVVTRVFACVLVLPLLTVYVVFLALGGCYFAMTIEQDMPLSLFITQILEIIDLNDVAAGIGKTFIFGFLVGVVGAYKGYHAAKGTEGVGKASTTSVVLASLLILVIDMVLVKVSMLLWPVS